MYSITLDARTDDTQALASYAEDFGCLPGWTYLTGDYDELEEIRYKMGAYDPDPEIDKDKTQHAGVVVYGSESHGRWAAIPGLAPPQRIVRALGRLTPGRK